MQVYSCKAQPYLDAIANAIFDSQEIRDWLIRGTPVEAGYTGSSVLTDEQRAVRWRRKPTIQPFWANYFCNRSACNCRIPFSKAVESDAIFFFRNTLNRTLAVHLEFKHPKEPFAFGQPEAYPWRAACFVNTHRERVQLNEHHCWTTVLFCGGEMLSDPRCFNFQRIITHDEAAQMIAAYPPARRMG